VIIEVVFSVPGIGRLLMNAVLFNDFPVLQTGVLLVAFAVTFVNLLADISYSFLDRGSGTHDCGIKNDWDADERRFSGFCIPLNNETYISD